MGKIPSPHELFTGNFAKPGAHQLAAEQIMESMELIADDVGVENFGSMTHGSVGIGKETRFSDIDFIAVYPQDFAEYCLYGIRGVLKEVNRQSNVEIEYNLISSQEAVEGRHIIYPMFKDYLMGAQTTSRFVQGRPIDAIKIQGNPDFYADMDTYLTKKRSRFDQTEVNYTGEVNWHLYTRALAVPKAILGKYNQLGLELPTSLSRTYLTQTNDIIAEAIEAVLAKGCNLDDVIYYDQLTKEMYPEVIRNAYEFCKQTLQQFAQIRRDKQN